MLIINFTSFDSHVNKWTIFIFLDMVTSASSVVSSCKEQYEKDK